MYKDKICDVCLEMFSPSTGKQRRCSIGCRIVAKARYDRGRKGLTRKKKVRYIVGRDFLQLMESEEWKKRSV